MHLKRYNMPGYWGLKTKEETFVRRPRGPHPKQQCIPLQVVLRDVLKFAATRKEAVRILSEGNVLVDAKVRKDPAFAVGLMDILDIPAMKKTYMVDINRRGLCLTETSADGKLCRIIGKTTVRGGKLQLNLHDGKNVLADSTAYNVGDSVFLSLPEQSIQSHLPLKKGNVALIVAGKNTGTRGAITDISEKMYMMEKATVTLDADGRSVETLRKYVFVTSGSNRKPVSKREAPKKKERAT